jgi:hypothetical protein
MAKGFFGFQRIKTSWVIRFLVISLLIFIAYQSVHYCQSILPQHVSQSTIIIKQQLQYFNQRHDETITFERRTLCNYKNNQTCYSTNKSLVVTFWDKKSVDKWVSQNILSAFPLHSFDHIIFVHDNSSWNSHPGYQHFIWIHITGQHRLWYLKRFLLPTIAESYAFIWIIDDDAKLNFNSLHYQCIVKNLNVSLSAPARLAGKVSHPITRMNASFRERIGRWTDFIETGPIVVASSLVWQCIYTLIDASTGTGWGIDLVWCNMLAEHCPLSKSEHRKVCAILDAFTVDHQSTGVNSGKEGTPELGVYTLIRKAWSAKRQNIGPLAKDNKLITICSQ